MNFKNIFFKRNSELKVWDTSYIRSEHCNFEEADENIVILRSVFEQLAFQTRGGNRYTKTFLSMIATDKIKPRMECKVYLPKDIPPYEDKADFEILEYAKQHKKAVVYTCDRGLAARCKQNNIKCEYFQKQQDGSKKNIPFLYDNQRNELKIYSRAVYVFDENSRLVNPNEKGEILCKDNYIIAFRNKSYIIKERELKAV
ncbi:MAG: hypothetical protein IKV94_00315 [Clostridia bacterium]|nr:hypothetical protein [Clostridia bacterium]